MSLRNEPSRLCHVDVVRRCKIVGAERIGVGDSSMQKRFLSIAAAVGALALAGLLPQQASALTGVGRVELQAGPALVRQAGSRYLRRYDPPTGTYVRAPF